MTHPQPFCIASDLELPAQDVLSLLNSVQWGGVATLNGGGEVYGLGGFFTFASRHANLLLERLPGVLHLRREEDRIALRWLMESMMRELQEPRPGGSLMAQQLALTMLVQALRQYLAQERPTGVGWLQGLADQQISKALEAMHAEPERSWTLPVLAKHAGMSRSGFAERFRATVGETPLAYLTRWRMLVAGDHLSHSDAPISAIAHYVGYESESAFSAAFKRQMGCSPREFRPRGD